jgi:predicted nucleic acid-binding Zn ribbon protein
MYCPYCGKEIPEKWVKQRTLLIKKDTVVGHDVHCFDCGIDIEIINKTAKEACEKQYYENITK